MRITRHPVDTMYDMGGCCRHNGGCIGEGYKEYSDCELTTTTTNATQNRAVRFGNEK